MSIRLPRLGQGERQFIRNALTFMGGRSFAVGLTLLLTPFIARLYEPADWGHAALFLAICATVGEISCLRYELAIPMAPDARRARQMLTLCWNLSLLVTLSLSLVFLVLLLTGSLPKSLIGLGSWIWWLPLGMALDSFLTSLQAWLIRHKKYAPLASGEIAQVLGRSGVRLIAGAFLGSTLAWLILSYIISYFVKIALFLRACKNEAALSYDRREPRPPLLALAAEYKEFPIYNAPTGFLMMVTKQLPMFVLAAYFGPAAAGFFAMADRLIRTPIYVTSNSIRQIFLQKAADTARAGRSIKPALRKTVLVLTAIALLPSIGLWFFGQEILVLMLGEKWSAAGKIGELMAPFLFVQWLGSPFQGAAIVMREQKLWFWLQALAAVSRLIIIPMAMFMDTTANEIVSVFVWSASISQAIVMIVIWRRVPANSAPRPMPPRARPEPAASYDD